VDTAEAIAQRSLQALQATVIAVQRRDAATELGPDWRLTSLGDDERRISGSLATMSTDEALSADLILLDASLQGQPRSAAWTYKAIELLEQADVDQQTEVERLQAELEHEQQLRAERQRRADEKLAEYVAYLQAERQPRSGLPTIVERLGRRFSVVDEKPPVPLAPFSLGESEPRTSSNPRVQAYYRWRDTADAVNAGDELNRRTVPGANGVEVLIESALAERLEYLRRQVGLRVSRLGRLHEHLAMLETPPAVPQKVLVRDGEGHETRGALPPKLSASDIPMQQPNLTPRAY
jgi:hypothetical protein